MSATATVDASSTIGSEARSEGVVLEALPRWAEIKRAIRDEARKEGVPCGRRKADLVIGMLLRAARHARNSNYRRSYRLRGRELRDLHEVLYTVMPDDIAIPMPGSAHELISRRILQGRELAIVHTMEGDDHCVVAPSASTRSSRSRASNTPQGALGMHFGAPGAPSGPFLFIISLNN